MAVELKVPSMGESVQTAVVAKWLRAEGDILKVDEPLVALDSDKATLEVPAPAAGRLTRLAVAAGDEVTVGQVIAYIEDAPQAEASSPAASPQAVPSQAGSPQAVPPQAANPQAPSPQAAPRSDATASVGAPAGPAVRRAAAEAGLQTGQIPGSGEGGRVLREDVTAAAARRDAGSASAGASPTSAPATPAKASTAVARAPAGGKAAGEEEVVPMTTIRKRIGERLLAAQQNAAILTTFNEVDMSAVMALRERYQERFQKRYGLKLGFMSFFVKATIEALKAFPSANAEIRGDDIVYKHYYHIGVAVSGPRGLVVPVVRNADQLSFAETEAAISAFGQKARDNQITLDDLSGGTFTISNGGIFGSLMSTPILNPPQVAILGMHAIQKRAVVVDDEIVIRPMMYLALSYDHRLLDGREAVSTLVRIKECVENPERVLLEI